MPARVTIKDHLRESRLFNGRAVWAVLIVLGLLCVIAARLVYLQVLNHSHYATLSDGNRISLMPIPPMRGFIHDRNGVVLAQNVPSFSLELTPEKVDGLEDTIARLRELIDITDDDIRRFYRQLRGKRPFASIPLRFNLTDAEMARFAVERHHFPGVETEARVLRYYPQGPLAAHAVGYVGRINEEELRRLDSNYSATDFIGKTGAERYHEPALHGHIGFRQVESNALGRSLRELSRTDPEPGQSLYLTIDADLQKVAEEAIGDRRGVVVALEPSTGDILVLASMPSYDPNLFVTGIDQRTFSALQDSLDKPLFNRALRGQYPPGSTIKPFLGLAGLEDHRISISSSLLCRGWFSLEGDSHRFRDWKEHGHGRVDVQDAIAQSCDVFFYDLAVNLGIDRIHDYLAYFGFGRLTGTDLRDERSGLIPSRTWKRGERGEPWYRGETVIAGIGQGYMLATPLQLAHAAAALAMRGAAHPPRLVRAIEEAAMTGRLREIEPAPPLQIPVVSPANWDAIIEAMRLSVHSARGTAAAVGREARFPIAGKTGTAQVFGIRQDERYVEEDVAERLRDHALFVAFAPIDKPRIAVSVVIENGGSGSSVVAPVAARVIDHYLGRPPS